MRIAGNASVARFRQRPVFSGQKSNVWTGFQYAMMPL
jgi:hypothetical protein